MSKFNLTLAACVVQSPELDWTGDGSLMVDRQVALMSLQNGAYYGLDPVGSRIWELIARPQSIARVCAQLQQEYEITAPQCEPQVLGFLVKLAEADLVRVVTEPGANSLP